MKLLLFLAILAFAVSNVLAVTVTYGTGVCTTLKLCVDNANSGDTI